MCPTPGYIITKCPGLNRVKPKIGGPSVSKRIKRMVSLAISQTQFLEEHLSVRQCQSYSYYQNCWILKQFQLALCNFSELTENTSLVSSLSSLVLSTSITSTLLSEFSLEIDPIKNSLSL